MCKHLSLPPPAAQTQHNVHLFNFVTLISSLIETVQQRLSKKQSAGSEELFKSNYFPEHV